MKAFMDLTSLLAVSSFLHTSLGAPHNDVRSIKIWTDSPIQRRTNRVIPVVVGGPQSLFVPNLVRAGVGDIVQFQFSNGNHTVTQSAPDVGCQPLQKTKAEAIHSGHIPFLEGQQEVGTFNMPITTAEPMFLYCATGPHCQIGQVMIINPTNEDQVVNYAKLSMAAQANVDGAGVSGGTVGKIPLASAAFIPAKPKKAT